MPNNKRFFFVAVILCGASLSGGWGFLIAADLQETAGVRDAAVQNAYLDKESQTVYGTDKGKKYHLEGCRYLKDSKRPLSLDEARKSYSPCRVCKAPK